MGMYKEAFKRIVYTNAEVSNVCLFMGVALTLVSTIHLQWSDLHICKYILFKQARLYFDYSTKNVFNRHYFNILL